MTKELAREFDRVTTKLNGHLWFLLVLSANDAARARTLKSLDGLPHQSVLPALYPGSKALAAKVRLRNSNISGDLEDLSSAVSAWIPAYFVVLARSAAEGLLVEHLLRLYSTDSGFRQATDRKRLAKPPSRKVYALTKERAIERITGHVLNGTIPPEDEILEVRPSLGAHNADVLQQLKRHRKVRNAIAHKLAEALHSSPPVTVADLADYIGALKTVLMHA